MGARVRTTVHLEQELVVRARRVVPPRGLNRFVNEALAEKLDLLEQQKTEKAMREGYLATRRDRAALARDWEVVDVEDWPA